MVRYVWVVVALLVAATAQPASGQGLRSLISELFVFGSGEQPLFLAGSADPDNPESIQVHGEHFVPSAVESNGALIDALAAAVGSNIANLPLSSTSGGFTFRFEGGLPVRTSTSPGPIFAERAQTLGQGRVLVSANVNAFTFNSFRGVGLDNLTLNFTHQNVDFPGCDVTFGNDCSLYGVPQLENDVIRLNLDMNIAVKAPTIALTYGLLDMVDVGVAIPLVFVSFTGTSNAEVLPLTGPPVAHFFSGTSADPGLTAQRFVEGSASGIGDVAARVKIALNQAQNARVALLADARFATGNADDLLGSGAFVIRGMGIVSATLGPFSPHANVGYVYRDSEVQNDAILATVGFDHVLAPWAALAVDVASEFQIGDAKLLIPDPVKVDAPYPRTFTPSNIPNMRDDIVNGSFGFKFVTSSGVTIVTNAIVPLNDGGMRAAVLWTTGLEYGF